MPELAALKLNADLSHWCCVCEHVFDAKDPRDDFWPPLLKLLAKHCEFIHCRIGHAQGPQVPEPEAPEAAADAEAHYSWWRTIWAAQAERVADTPDATVWAEPEFGPPPYQQTTPYTGVPVGDLWDINSRVASRVRKEFEAALTAPKEEAPKAAPPPAPAHWRTDKEALAAKAAAEAAGSSTPGSSTSNPQGVGGGLLDLALKKEKAQEKEAAKAAKEYEKLKKTVIKEGGKKGVEIEGASELGGLDFFCTTVELPEGKEDLLELSMLAMNAEPDPEAEDRKGCSGLVGKMIFSAGVEQLGMVAYVPDAAYNKSANKVDVTKWMDEVCKVVGGSVVKKKTAVTSLIPDKRTGALETDGKIVATSGKTTGSIVSAVVKSDPEKGKFALKDKDAAMAAAFGFLRANGAFPEDDGDDSDDMIFGDDDDLDAFE